MRGALAALAALVLLSGCGDADLTPVPPRQEAEALPVLHPVPPFRFEDQSGASVDATRLAGKVWVLNTFLVCCPGKCPEMTTAIRELQDATPGETDLCFLSLSSDPEHETTEQLAEYASRFGADPARWTFARASKEATDEFLFEGLKVDGDRENPVNHSFRLVLVDRQGRIRGYYRSLETAERKRLLADARRLLDEPTSAP